MPPRNSFMSKGGNSRSATKRGRGTFRKKDSFTFDDLRFYLFKHGVNYSALLYSSVLRLNRDDKKFLLEEHPVVKGFVDTEEGGMESLLRADSLASFLSLQALKASAIIKDGEVKRIEDIPFPPYVPKKFMSDLEIAVKEACNITDDRKAEMIEKGYKEFVYSISMLMNNVYSTLFRFLKSTNATTQEIKRQKVSKAYIGFLSSIDGNTDLQYFCKWISLDPLFRRIKNRHYKLKPKKGSTLEDLMEKDRLSHFDKFLTSQKDVFFQLAPEEDSYAEWKHSLFAPAMFSGSYSYMNSELFGVSVTDILLHFSPLIKNMEDTLREEKETDIKDGGNEDETWGDDDWNYTVTISDMQNFFVYKKEKAFRSDIDSTMSNTRAIDRKKLSLQERVKDITGQTKLPEDLNALGLSETMITLIEAEVDSFRAEFEISAKEKFTNLLGKSYFEEFDESERVLSMFNVIRISFYENRGLLPKIDNDFYGNIRNKLLKDIFREMSRTLNTVYQMEKKKGNIGESRKQYTSEKSSSETNVKKTDTSPIEQEEGYGYEEEKTEKNKSDNGELKKELKDEFFS